MLNSSSMLQNNCSVMTNWKHFSDLFKSFYGQIGLTLSIISICFNLCNIVVLSQRKMRTSTNIILRAIAISDLLVCLTVMPSLIYANLTNKFSLLQHFYWALLYTLSNCITLTFHTASVWLGVVLAMFRYFYIRLYSSSASSRRQQRNSGLSRVCWATLLVYIVVIVVFTPYYVTMRVTERFLPRYNLTYYRSHRVDLGPYDDVYLFWSIAIFAKVSPCLLMGVFGGLLLSTLNSANLRRTGLIRSNTSKSATLSHLVSSGAAKRLRDHRRTTRLLIAILLFVVPIELPQGLLIIATRYSPLMFCVYRYLGDLLDCLSLVKNCVIFLLYCCMSCEYRTAFRHTLFIPGVCSVRTSTGGATGAGIDATLHQSYMQEGTPTASAVHLHRSTDIVGIARAISLFSFLNSARTNTATNISASNNSIQVTSVEVLPMKHQRNSLSATTGPLTVADTEAPLSNSLISSLQESHRILNSKSPSLFFASQKF